MADGYIAPEELALVKQLENSVRQADRQLSVADFALQAAHAEKRAAEAELRAAEAEYQGTIMKLLWQYKLERGCSFRQSDGLIMRGEKNGEESNKEDDASGQSEESKGDG